MAKVRFKHPVPLSDLRKFSIGLLRWLFEFHCAGLDAMFVTNNNTPPTPLFLQLNNMICLVKATTCQLNCYLIRLDDFMMSWNFKRALLRRSARWSRWGLCKLTHFLQRTAQHVCTLQIYSHANYCLSPDLSIAARLKTWLAGTQRVIVFRVKGTSRLGTRHDVRINW